MKFKVPEQLLKPSTNKFMQEAQRIDDFSRFHFLHGYVYIRWPYLYIGIGTGEHPIAKILAPVVRQFTKFFKRLETRKQDRAETANRKESNLQKITFADTYLWKSRPS